MSKVKKLTLSAILVSVVVVCSPFYIPVGIAKCYPVQHLVNVIAGVFIGPWYALCMAFIASLIRVLSGTGSPLAFPGSMCGALLCGILYKYTNKLIFAYIGEIIGTGIIGASLAYPIALGFMGSSTATLYTFIIPFSISTIGGTLFSSVLFFALNKVGVFSKIHI